MNNFLKKISIIVLTAVLIAGCNQAPTNNSANSKDGNQTQNEGKKTLRKAQKPKAEEVVPMLKVNFDGTEKEFKLRSQIATYTNASKSEIKIMLANTFEQSCTKPNPELKEEDQRIIITLKNKDTQKALEKVEFKPGTDYTFIATLESKGKKENFELKAKPEDLGLIQLTDLNDAIIRGKIQLNDGKKTVNGEFFAAICKK